MQYRFYNLMVNRMPWLVLASVHRQDKRAENIEFDYFIFGTYREKQYLCRQNSKYKLWQKTR